MSLREKYRPVVESTAGCVAVSDRLELAAERAGRDGDDRGRQQASPTAAAAKVRILAGVDIG